jgi:hypothetical protein
MGVMLSHVGRDVWVGGFAACDAEGPTFARIVHVYNPAAAHSPVSCRRMRESLTEGLAVRWIEREPVEAMEPGIDAVAEYMGRPGRLLVHCAGGVTRSPTLALLALAMRGEPLYCGFGAVYEGLWRSGVTFAPCPRMIGSLLRWYERVIAPSDPASPPRA